MVKAQAMVISTLVLVVFIIVVISLLVDQFGLLQNKNRAFFEVKKEANIVGNMLLQNPNPINWNEQNVKKIGLIEGKKITIASLNKYGDLSYPKTKMLLGVKYDYIFYFVDTNGEVISIGSRQFWGWNDLESGNGGSYVDDVLALIIAGAENVANNEKFVIVDGDDGPITAKMIINVWDYVDAEALDLHEDTYDFSAYLDTEKKVYASGEDIRLTG